VPIRGFLEGIDWYCQIHSPILSVGLDLSIEAEMGKNAKEDNLYKGSNMSKIEKGMTLQSRTQKS